MGKPCLHFISGGLWATGEDNFYKMETRFLSTFTVGGWGFCLFFNPGHKIMKASLHFFEFISA